MGVLILGATSTIARATANEYARLGSPVYLAARDLEEAERLAADLRVRHGVTAQADTFDARVTGGHGALIQRAAEALDGLDTVVVAFGEMGDQAAAEADFDNALPILETNYVGAISICEETARVMIERGRGTIIGISSVAGDRGRQSNYFYGSAKGGFSLYLQGLRARLRQHGIHVVAAKLGFVDTPMTYGLKTKIPIASPEGAAKALVNAGRKRRDTFYYPWFWRYVMFIVKAVPERVFKRLKM